MTREKWKLTKAATTDQPQIDAWGDSPEIPLDSGREDLTLGFSMMRALAEADETLVEIEDGVWRHTAPSTLDILFHGLDEDDGVKKLGPGVYEVRNDGWL